MKVLLNSICFLFVFFNCSAQEFKYRKISEIPSFITYFDEKNESEAIIKRESPSDLTRYLPVNYKKDGSVDYTKYLQKGIDENTKVLLPNFPVLINDNGLELRSNSVIIFNTGTSLILKASEKTNYQILRIHNKDNVLVFSPKIKGDRNHHLNKKGEWGMGISIVSSSNIQIINAHVTNCWGDGIYLGQQGNKTNKQISIINGIIDNNRRNAISVISVNGLKISNIILSNTHGTSPESGLDFEPNKNNEELRNINVENIYTFNNKINGVVYYLGRLRGHQAKTVQIDINNHMDNYSRNSIGYSSTGIKGRERGTLLKGNINLVNVDSKNSKNSFVVYNNTLDELINLKLYPANSQKYKAVKKREFLNIIQK